jgi:hypothetical protein
VLEEVLDLFAEHNFEIMLVKGEALNLTVYREPWYTVSLDIDLVIKAQEKELSPDQQRQIDSLFATIHTINDNSSPLKENIEYDFHEHHDVNLNGVLPVDALRTWEDARKQEYRGRSLYIMAPEDMLIAATVQSLRKRFFKLKPACDIAEIIGRYPDMPWENLVRKARAYKCNTILYTALIVTQMLLDCDFPVGLLDELAVNPVRSAAIRHLVRRLYYDYSLESLRARSQTKILGRRVSLSLLLTYATFRADTLLPKLGEIVKGRNNPDGDFF